MVCNICTAESYSFLVIWLYLWVLTFPLLDCSEFGNFVITLISYTFLVEIKKKPVIEIFHNTFNLKHGKHCYKIILIWQRTKHSSQICYRWSTFTRFYNIIDDFNFSFLNVQPLDSNTPTTQAYEISFITRTPRPCSLYSDFLQWH